MLDFTWFNFRSTALVTLIGFLIDIEINLITLGFLLFHINSGLKTIFDDYIHIKKIKLLLFFLIRLFIIELTVRILEFLL